MNVKRMFRVSMAFVKTRSDPSLALASPVITWKTILALMSTNAPIHLVLMAPASINLALICACASQDLLWNGTFASILMSVSFRPALTPLASIRSAVTAANARTATSLATTLVLTWTSANPILVLMANASTRTEATGAAVWMVSKLSEIFV